MYRCTKLCTVYVDNTGKPVITGLSIWISMKLEFSCSLYICQYNITINSLFPEGYYRGISINNNVFKHGLL